ncbi:CLUMA_CG020471, isoform A [Clunio marinus]|uniref:Adenylyltransferase and sulfurtransferase MOCS3 homolog n=1 Tax=Clunio marinus TaxID=568069 RepID=A0A1J1J931_9DIPT|nr:CLUMA_CG020471, isoform A [Clunio marinus]
MELTNREIARYSRQIILPGIGVKGQKRLKASSVLIVGAGGLGCPVSSNLAGAGIGTLGIIDYDNIEITNLHRQLLHSESSIGKSKVESIKNFIANLNSDVKVQTHQVLLNSKNALEIITKYDLVVDASDNVATRYLLNDACVLENKTLISGSALQMEGQMTVYNYKNGPCYRCIFPKPPPPETVQNCGDGGVLGAITGVIGSLQSMEVIKVILDHDDVLAGKLLLYDGASCSFRTIKLRNKRQDCDVCGVTPNITKLIDYEQFCGMAASDKDSGLNILESNERVTVEDYRNYNKDHLLIDVRSANEFEICKLNNAINIPIKRLLADKIDNDLKEEMKEKSVFVVCRRGNDSQLAVRHLNEKLGIRSKDLIGGLHSWTHTIDKDFPIY